jgi:hypothetical protein
VQNALFAGDIWTEKSIVCLIVNSRLGNFAAIRRLSPLPVKELQI